MGRSRRSRANGKRPFLLKNIKFCSLHVNSSSALWLLKYVKSAKAGWRKKAASTFLFAPAMRAPLALINLFNLALLANSYLPPLTQQDQNTKDVYIYLQYRLLETKRVSSIFAAN